MPEPPSGRLEGVPLSVDDMLAMPMFEGCSESLLRKNQGAVVRRTFSAGDTICREGDFGSTAFFILEGETEVFLAAPIAHLQGAPRRSGLFGGIRTFRDKPRGG